MDNQSDPELIKLVSGHVLFGQLEPQELKRVLAFSRTERFPAGQVIFRRGEPGHSMLTVISRRV